MECFICVENYNKVSHRKIQCCFCGFECCHRCIQKYILSEIQDPHCMKCKKIWSREFLDERLSKQFINNELKTHRENTLFEKEKNLLPETQDNVKLLFQQEEMDLELKSIEQQMHTLQKKYDEIERKRNDINPYQILPRSIIRINRIQCPVKDCRGFAEQIEQHMTCGICHTIVCISCNEIKEKEHICKQENIKTILLLEKETKRCPSCYVKIFKISGCDQMWCTSCHIAFDWKTGEQVHGIIHNPHYHEYIEQNGVNHIRVEESYHRFEFLNPDIIRQQLELQNCNELIVYQILEVYRYIINYYQNDLQRLPTRFDQIINLDLRIHYLKNIITEDEFKMKLQRRQKDIEKKIEYHDIGETYVDIMNDVFISFVQQNYPSEKLIYDIKIITKTTQDAMINLNKRYNSNMPLVRTLL